MAEKGTKQKSGRVPVKPGRQGTDDHDATVARLNERIAALESELQSAREALRDRQDDMEVQAEALKSQIEELNAANDTLARDARARQESEEALRKSQYILAKSQEMAHVGNWAWIVSTGEMKWSDESFRIFGYSPHVLKTGWEWLESCVHADDRCLLAELSDAVRAGNKKGVDVRVYLPDGSVRYVNVVADKVVTDKAGKVVRAYGIFQDITERKRMEKALQEKMDEVEVQSEEMESQNEELRANNDELNSLTRRLHESETLLRSVTDTSPDAIFAKDRDCRILMANPATLRIIGKPPERVIGKCDSEFYDDPAIGEAIMANDRRIMAAGRIEVVEEIGQTPEGYRTYLSTKAPIRDDRGEITGIMGIARDITERKRIEERLRKQAALIDLSPDGIIVRKPDGEITFWSKGAEAMYGWAKEEAVGEQTHALFDTRFPKPLREIVSELQQTGLWSGELVHRTKDGREITVQSWWLGRLDESGVVTEILESNVDITTLKQVQETLQEKMEEIETQAEELESQNEELRANYDELIRANRSAEESIAKLEAVFASMNDGVCIMDADHNIVSINEAFARFHRFENKDAYVRSVGEYGDFIELYTPDGKLVPMEDWPILRGFRGETASNFEVLIRRTDTGAQWYGNYSYAPIRDREGRIVGSVLTMRDITEHKRAEEALRTSEARRKVAEAVEAERRRFFDILETLPAYLILLTPDYHVPFANRFFRERFGESHGKRCYEYLFGRSEPCENCETYKVLKTGAPHHWEWTGPDGRDYDIYDYPFKDADGSPLIMEMGIDITERKRAEAALCRSRDELEQRVSERTLELQHSNDDLITQVEVRKQAEEELKEANAQAELYLDLMGHDISNMHQIALSQLELAEEILREEGKIDAGEAEMIGTPIETLRRSASLIENVRKLQKLRAGEYRIEDVDLGRVLDEVVREHTLTGNGVTINYTPANGCLVKANPLIKEAFVNLVGNAIKHSHGRPTIDISVSQVYTGNGAAYYRIVIEDDGPGIPDDKKDEVFHRFRRGQTHARGTGLGLYIVKTLVENFEGQVRVENRIPDDYSKGSKFIVDLPIAEDYHE